MLQGDGMSLSLLAEMAVVMMMAFGDTLHQNASISLLKLNQDDETVAMIEIDPDMVELIKDQTFQFDANAYSSSGNYGTTHVSVKVVSLLPRGCT
jgi:hypothetical protein